MPNIIVPDQKLCAPYSRRRIPANDLLSSAGNPNAITMLIIEQGGGTISVRGQLSRFFEAGDIILLPKNASFALCASHEVGFKYYVISEREDGRTSLTDAIRGIKK
jgi:hypothetical protein